MGLVQGTSIPIGQTHRLRLSTPISYGPNNIALEMPVDTYLFYQKYVLTR